ncbi:MAG: aminodeoxychorismate lyase [Bacillota bacterium]|nr:aminodeoxychorismate lyase [Bacillota bacterium]
MKINILNSFASGILISTIICGTVYLSDTKAATTQHTVIKKIQLSKVDMIDKLTAAGYVVQKKADYDKSMKTSTPAPASNSNKVVYRVAVNVSEGMTAIDVGKVLQNSHIIPDAFKFQQDIHNRGIENKLRPGTFVIDSGMSYDQIVSTIFKN